MRTIVWMCVLALSAGTASAQQADSTKKAKADSAAKAIADSVALFKEFEKLNAAKPPAPATGGFSGPANPRMLPDFSAVGDLVGDLSPKGSTQGDGTRLGVREVELAVQAVVDPYFRGDVFLGINDLEKISIEQAFLTTTSLPYGLQLRLGRYLMPVGKQNTTHRHDLHTVEYPYVIQRFFADEGLKGTGISASKVFAPFGFYQELIVTAVDRFGESAEGLTAHEPVNKNLDGMGFSARLRNYIDLSQDANFELSASAITGKREQPLGGEVAAGENALNVRQTLVGADLSFRWKPLQQGLYKSFLFQAEMMRQLNGTPGAAEFPASVQYLGPSRDFTGGYVFARWQLAQRLYIGGRYDSLQDPMLDGANTTAGQGFVEWFPSEFSKLVASYERLSQHGLPGMDRILLQASFAVGPHKPHPF